MRYRWQTGSVAWIIHRGSGIFLTLYIFAHLYILTHLKDPKKYAELLGLLENPLVKLGEICLLAMVIAHALNGVRLTLLDLGAPAGVQKTLFLVLVVLGGGTLFLLGAWPILGGAH